MKTEDSFERAQRFARNFRTYPAEAHVQRNAAEALVAALTDLARGRTWDRVVELGCGTGLLTRAFLRRFSCRELHLVDLAENCQEFLKDIPYTAFSVSDLETVQQVPSSDLVLSASCLQWLKNPKRLFRRIHEALSPGGCFAASSFAEGNLSELAVCGGRPLVCPPDATWREWLEASGFSVRHFASWTETLRFESSLAALRHLKRTGVLIPVSESYRAVRRFLERYEDLRKDDLVPLTYKPVLWVAQKQ